MHSTLPAAFAAAILALPFVTTAGDTCKAGAMTASRGERNLVETARAAGSFETLLGAVKAAGLADALMGEGPFTVFAPTDEAFAALPGGTVQDLLRPERRADLAAILTYHVVPGRVTSDAVVKLDSAATLNGQRVAVRVDEGSVMIDGAKVVKADIRCSNGVIHVIDRVLLPSTKTIVDAAVSTKELSTLVAAVKAADLVDALAGEGPFTVFAPLDSAFAKLPAGVLEGLLEPEAKEKLQGVLTYHVVPGRVYAAQLGDGQTLKTLQGGTLAVEVKDGMVRVGGAQVKAADVQTANGVVHVIDSVLLPR
jgi:uncharacterized surface protein with fasciclin (FAS1) repeats